MKITESKSYRLDIPYVSEFRYSSMPWPTAGQETQPTGKFVIFKVLMMKASRALASSRTLVDRESDMLK